MNRHPFVSAAGAVLASAMFLNTQVAAQILRIGEMNTQQIQALDLAKTVVLIPRGRRCSGTHARCRAAPERRACQV